jgi:hypothetical protein
MAKFLLVCARDPSALSESRFRRACELLAADEITPPPPDVRRSPGLAIAIVPATAAVATHGTAVCLGQMFERAEDWWVPGSAVPDGTFAMIRADETCVELATDAVCSRSIFHAATDSMFVASSSQRAIVAVLGSFRLNPVAVSWMLSSGSLGPGNGWDDRMSRVGADARVLLDRGTWKVTSRATPVVFRPERRSRQEHASRLREAILGVCDGLDLGGGEWRLPLSGGYDSRFLLLSLSRRRRVPCVTWGVRAAVDDPQSDAAIARSLADHVGAPHEFFPLDGSSEPLDVLFDRYVRNGDGCVDAINPYMDGFAVWRHLHDAGVAGIVRGDEALGARRAHLAYTVPIMGAARLAEYYRPREIAKLALADQPWPAALERERGESVATWRDRLYQVYRAPVILASLNELKAAYVEVVNPLLSRRVLEVARTLPDELRTDKSLFREVVAAATPPVPFATRNAIPDFHALVASRPFRAMVRRDVIVGREEGSLPAPLVEHVLAALPRQDEATRVDAADAAPHHRASLRDQAIAAVLRRYVPRGMIRAVRAVRPPGQAPGVLAFRAALVARTARMLGAAAATAPADAGRPGPLDPGSRPSACSTR